MSSIEKRVNDRDKHPEPTGIHMHREWAWLCIAWRAFLSGACKRSRAPLPSGLRPEAWVVLHLDDCTYIIEWVDGEGLARAHRVRDGSMPEPNGLGPIDVNHPPSLRFRGVSLEEAPRVSMMGCFSMRYGVLDARAGFVTARLVNGRFEFEEDATIVS